MTNSKIKVLSLDIGGVCFLGGSTEAFFARWAEETGFDRQTFQQKLWYGHDIEQANIGQISADTYFERTAERLETTPAVVRAIIEDYFFPQRNDLLVEYIRQIKSHVRVTALTNNWSFARDMFERHGVSDLFELLINSAEVGVRKPNPEIFQVMLEQVGVAPQEILFVDDTFENIEVAERLGIQSIHFQSTEQTIRELRKVLDTSD